MFIQNRNIKKIKTPVSGETLFVLLTGRHAMPVVTRCWCFYSLVLLMGQHATPFVIRWFTVCATDLIEQFLPSSIFYLALCPAFQDFPGADSSTSKLAGVHPVLWNMILAKLFVWITQQITNLVFKKSVFKQVTIHHLRWKV